MLTGGQQRRQRAMKRRSRHDPPRDGSRGNSWTHQRLSLSSNKELSVEEIKAKKLTQLPMIAEDYYYRNRNLNRNETDDDDNDREQGNDAFVLEEKYGWSETLRTILAGTRSSSTFDREAVSPLAYSPFILLRGHESTLVRHIYSFLAHEYTRHVKLTIPASLVGNFGQFGMALFVEGRTSPHWSNRVVRRGPLNNMYHEDNLIPPSSGYDNGYVAFAKCGTIEFPEPNDRNVNMMPFVLGDRNSLPYDLECYYGMIEKCPYVREEIGQVAYLTVHESYVDAGQTQRRPGLHIESPGVFPDNDNANNESETAAGGGEVGEPATTAANASSSFTPGVEHAWGLGVFFGSDHYEGGIYFASNVSNTSAVYDALVDNRVPGIVDRHGGCEHLRQVIRPTRTVLKNGELVWMTDCTPHEALEQPQPGGYRQFFRLVMPYVSHWYADHSTPNPKVPLPDHVKVIRGSKF